MNQPILDCRNVSYSYHNLSGETLALSNLSFQVQAGEFLSIVGPSGCGKSTLLSLIAGLSHPEEGEIIINIEDKSRIGYMLQQDHLFEWRSIRRNVLLGPEINHILSSEHQTLADRLLKDYGLDKFQYKRPCELSGGMKQRAALIRTMLMHPKLLLLDEHTAALDPKTAAKVLEISDKIIAENQLTAMMVTHNMKDAIVHGNRLIMMHEGKVIYDVAGEEKKNLQVKDLLAKFEEVSGGEFANDRMMLA